MCKSFTCQYQNTQQKTEQIHSLQSAKQEMQDLSDRQQQILEQIENTKKNKNFDSKHLRRLTTIQNKIARDVAKLANKLQQTNQSEIKEIEKQLYTAQENMQQATKEIRSLETETPEKKQLQAKKILDEIAQQLDQNQELQQQLQKQLPDLAQQQKNLHNQALQLQQQIQNQDAKDSQQWIEQSQKNMQQAQKNLENQYTTSTKRATKSHGIFASYPRIFRH